MSFHRHWRFPGIFWHTELLQLAFLELDRIGAGLHSDIDQLKRQVEKAIVIDADLGNDVGRMIRRRSGDHQF